MCPGHLRKQRGESLSPHTFENIIWRSGIVPQDWQTRSVLFLKKGDQKVGFSFRRMKPLSFSGKVYSKVLEKRIWLVVGPLIPE